MNQRTRNVQERSARESGAQVLTRKRGKTNKIERFYSTGNILSEETLFAGYKKGSRLQVMKRISPFLILGFFLVGLFPYMLITGEGAVHSTLLLIFLFIFLETNVLFADFALWNFFGGKKVLKIWLIEIPITFLIVHFLL